MEDDAVQEETSAIEGKEAEKTMVATSLMSDIIDDVCKLRKEEIVYKP